MPQALGVGRYRSVSWVCTCSTREVSVAQGGNHVEATARSTAIRSASRSFHWWMVGSARVLHQTERADVRPGGPPRLLWRPDHLSHAAAGGCSGRPCQKASSNSIGGISPHQECNRSRLYQDTHSAVASVTSLASFHGPSGPMTSFL